MLRYSLSRCGRNATLSTMSMVVLANTLFGCSLTENFERQSCSDVQDCQLVFGTGSTCTTEGYCQDVPTHPRCTITDPPDVFENWDTYRDAYIVGTLFDSTSDSSKIASSRLAFDDMRSINPSGGLINDKDIIQVICDYANDDNNELDGLREEDAVAEVTNFLVKTLGASVIVGPAGSGDASAAIQAAQERAVFISPSATAANLSTIDGESKTDEQPGYFWRTVGSDAFQAKVMSQIIITDQHNLVDDPYHKLGIIYQDNNYGYGFFSSVSQELTTNGFSYDFKTIVAGETETIASRINAMLGDGSVSGLVFVSSDKNDVIEALKTITVYPNVFLYLPDSAAKSAVIDGINDYIQTNEALRNQLVQQVKGTKPSLPTGPLFDNFQDKLNRDYGESATQSVFAAHTYDATWLAFLSILWVEYNEKLENGWNYAPYARGLRNVSDTSEGIELSPNNWNFFVNKFQEGVSINITGVSGSLDFDPTTEEVHTPIDIWTFNDTLEGFSVLYMCKEEGTDVVCGQ